VEAPLVSVGDDGRVFSVGGNEGKTKYELVNREKRKLTLGDIPFPLTCALHKDSILADPTAEEESIIETSVTVVLDSSGRLVSIQKPGGGVASMSTIKVCFLISFPYMTREIIDIFVTVLESCFVSYGKHGAFKVLQQCATS
jgi:exosome complex component RRP43